MNLCYFAYNISESAVGFRGLVNKSGKNSLISSNNGLLISNYNNFQPNSYAINISISPTHINYYVSCVHDLI